MDNLYISATSLIYDLRVTASLLRDHNRHLCATPEMVAAEHIVLDMIERVENASTEVYPPAAGSSPQAGMGS